MGVNRLRWRGQGRVELPMGGALPAFAHNISSKSERSLEQDFLTAPEFADTGKDVHVVRAPQLDWQAQSHRADNVDILHHRPRKPDAFASHAEAHGGRLAGGVSQGHVFCSKPKALPGEVVQRPGLFLGHGGRFASRVVDGETDSGLPIPAIIGAFQEMVEKAKAGLCRVLTEYVLHLPERCVVIHFRPDAARRYASKLPRVCSE